MYFNSFSVFASSFLLYFLTLSSHGRHDLRMLLFFSMKSILYIRCRRVDEKREELHPPEWRRSKGGDEEWFLTSSSSFCMIDRFLLLHLLCLFTRFEVEPLVPLYAVSPSISSWNFLFSVKYLQSAIECLPYILSCQSVSASRDIHSQGSDVFFLQV